MPRYQSLGRSAEATKPLPRSGKPLLPLENALTRRDKARVPPGKALTSLANALTGVAKAFAQLPKALSPPGRGEARRFTAFAPVSFSIQE